MVHTSRFVFFPSFPSLAITVDVCLFASFLFWGFQHSYLLSVKFVTLILLYVGLCLPVSFSYRATILSLMMPEWQQSSLTASCIILQGMEICRLFDLAGAIPPHMHNKGIGSSLASLEPRSKQILVFPDDWCYSIVLLLWWVLIRLRKFLWELIVSKKLTIYLGFLLLTPAFSEWGYQLLKKWQEWTDQWYKKKIQRRLNDGKPNPLKSEM